MINYILQVILFQALFLTVYDFFLAKETFFTKNRWYLLITGVGSFLIPLLKLPSFQEAVTKEVSIVLPEIVMSPQSIIEQTSIYQSFNYVSLVFWFGFSFFLLIFGYRLYKLIQLILKNSVQKKENYYLVLMPNSKKAFSFFDYVFIGTDIDENDKEKIISHELVHSKQRHSLDLLIFEGLKIVMWFNPLLYIYQKRISTVHEYISDSIIVESTEKKQYLNSLINQLFDVENISFVNQFYKKSLIKKRIIMITKEKSKQVMQAKYLLLVPLFLTMLFYLSCSDDFQNLETIVSKIQPQKMYLYSKDGLKEMDSDTKGAKESYLDFIIIFSDNIPNGWIEITKKDLTVLELNEYNKTFEKFEKLDLNNTNSRLKIVYKLFRNENDRCVLGMISKFDSNFKKISVKSNYEDETVDESIPFTIIDKVPTFPGCPENDSNCFNKKMQQHFADNFDSKLPNQLGLSSGNKRLIMLFKIDNNGDVVEIKAKAPHKTLEAEAIRVINLLPKMKPGEKDGEIVSVKYTLPVRIDVK